MCCSPALGGGAGGRIGRPQGSRLQGRRLLVGDTVRHHRHSGSPGPRDSEAAQGVSGHEGGLPGRRDIAGASPRDHPDPVREYLEPKARSCPWPAPRICRDCAKKPGSTARPTLTSGTSTASNRRRASSGTGGTVWAWSASRGAAARDRTSSSSGASSWPPSGPPATARPGRPADRRPPETVGSACGRRRGRPDRRHRHREAIGPCRAGDRVRPVRLATRPHPPG